MSTYRTVFPKRHTFLAVVHAHSLVQTLRNIEVALNNGADGVFLINHSISSSDLLGIHRAAQETFSPFWIGLNLLNCDPVSALFRLPSDVGGLWTDNAGIRESGSVSAAQGFLKARGRQPYWQGLYFGGVAFKHQEVISDAAKAARQALPYVDVITTSGSQTGSAPAPEKIRVMKEAVGEHPLAIASGVTPENVPLFMEHADCFLVATGVSESFTELDSGKVRALADILS